MSEETKTENTVPEKKFEVTDYTKTVMGTEVHRIRALRDFADIKAGDFGGFVESSDNLSDAGTCWIEDDACAMGDSYVEDNARLKDKAVLMDEAVARGRVVVYGGAVIGTDAVVSGDSKVYGVAHVYSDIKGNTEIGGDTVVPANRKAVDEFTEISKQEAEDILKTSFGEDFDPDSAEWKLAGNFAFNTEKQVLSHEVDPDSQYGYVIEVNIQTGERWHKGFGEGAFWVQDDAGTQDDGEEHEKEEPVYSEENEEDFEL